ncbi:MAG: hemolysin family protein [Anaerolineae bacterium]
MIIVILKMAAVVALVFANAFFVAAEFALVSVRRTKIEQLIREGNAPAKAVRHVINDPDRFIAATQLGITIASLGLGWIGEPALAHFIEPLLQALPQNWIAPTAHVVAAGAIAFTIITFLHVVLGELAPKSVALQYPVKTSLLVARPTALFENLFRPVIWLLNGTGNLLLRTVGLSRPRGHQLVHSVEELMMLVRTSREGGVLEAAEQEMLYNVFRFSDIPARQVMVPRTEMVCLSADASPNEVIDLAARHPYSKFPVYEQDLDNIIGIVHTRELLRFLQSGRYESSIRGLMHKPFIVPESIRVGDLLAQLKQRRIHMAILMDEFGGTAGLVTLEDLVEEIMGDVQDQFDTAEPEIQVLPDGSAILSGLVAIEEINEHFDLKLKDPNYDTIAGFVLGQLGRMATVGDEVETQGVRLRVEALDGLRIARLSLFRTDLEG